VAELTPRQALFVVEYLKDFNGKQAAISISAASVSCRRGFRGCFT
jgi:phage terminase small subunit